VRTTYARFVPNGFLAQRLCSPSISAKCAHVKMDELVKQILLLREIKPDWRPRSKEDVIWKKIVSGYKFKHSKMQKIITFLFVNSIKVGAILSAVLVFLLGRGIIAQDMATLISVVLVILGFAEKPLEVRYAAHVARVAAQHSK
jgi:hypothetical protein